MKGWFDLKQNKLVSLLTALALGASALLTPGLPVLAEETSAEPETVSLEGIYALRDFLLGHGIPQGTPVLDMDQNGSLDARDLTLAKRAYLDAESEDITLRNLRADQPDILLNEETVVTFTVSAQPAGLPEKTVALYDPDSEEPAAYMYDDGTHGDETALDGIYTAQLTLASDDFKNVDYYAAAGENKSDSFRICFYRELTPEEFAGYGALMNKLDAVKSLEEAVEIVKGSEDVTMHIIDEEHGTVCFDTVYHMNGMWGVPQEDPDVMGIGKYAIDKVYPKITFSPPANDALKVLPDCIITPAHPNKKKIITLIPFHSDGLSGIDITAVGNALARGLNTSVEKNMMLRYPCSSSGILQITAL